VHQSKQQAARMSEDVEAQRRGLDQRLRGAGAAQESKQQAARMSEGVGALRRGSDRRQSPVHQSKQQAARISEDVQARRRGLDQRLRGAALCTSRSSRRRG
jgi:hypothetical protein